MIMNLYPYNYYILYVSLFVTAFFLMMTIVKLPTLLKSLNHLSANIETISKHSEGTHTAFILLILGAGPEE